jgi:DNA-directed RNA polymerase subunit RPC12/RpoP
MPEISIRGYRCARCNHEWVPRNKKVMPVVCPKCKSPYWNIEKRKKKMVNKT